MHIAKARSVKTITAALAFAAGLGCGDGNEVTPVGNPGTNNPGGGATGSTNPGTLPGGSLPNVPGGTGSPAMDPATQPTTEMNCGVTNFKPGKQEPELLLVLDKSGSMKESATMPRSMVYVNAPDRKWDAITGAVDGVVKATQSSVFWGLQLFPQGSCGGGNVDIQPALNSHMQVMSVIGRNRPDGGTPTRAAVTAAAQAMLMRTTPNAKFIVLATDGLPTCKNNSGNTDDSPAAVAAIAASAMKGIPVFVIGIALEGADGTLNQMAEAGGRPRNDAKKYYPTSSGADFTKALESITQTIASCTYGLGGAIEANRPIAVNVDGKRILEGTGWAYGPGRMSIDLLGDICERIKSGEAKDVQVLKGCLGQTAPIP